MPDLINVQKTLPATTFVLGGDLLSQNIDGNYSTVRFYLKAVNGPGGNTQSQFNNYGRQEGHVEGLTHFGTHEGQPFLRSGVGNGAQRWLDVWDVNIGHGADGTRGGVQVRMYLGYGNVNESHYAWFDNFPRIPKTPAQPPQASLSNFTPTSVRINGSAPDNMGAGIEEYQFAATPTSGNTSQVFSSNNGPVHDIGGLTPGTSYRFQYRARNSRGWGPWSPDANGYVGLPAPTLTDWTQNASGALVATWTAPSNTNGLTGYRVQISTSSDFTTGVSYVDVGNVLTTPIGGLAGGRRYWARVAARTSGGVNAYSSSRDSLLILSAGDLNGWTRVGTKPAAISYFTNEGIRRGTVGSAQALLLESLATAAASLAADTFGMQRTVATVAGKAYRLSATATLATSAALAKTYRLAVGSTLGAPVAVPTNGVALPPVEFVADGSSTTLQLLLAEAVSTSGSRDDIERVALSNIRFVELNTDYPQRLRNTVYESNLSNHFDLACNSVGATWFVGTDGITRFRLPGAALPVSAVFTDYPQPGAVSYIDITAGFDTRTTVNRIEATNYGVDATGDQEENDDLVVEDLASQATYGLYRSTLAVNLHDEAPYTGAFQSRLTTLLAEHRTPEAFVSQIRWNAQEDLTLATALEIGQRITIRYRGRDIASQIVSIKHDITPTRWIVVLDLNPV